MTSAVFLDRDGVLNHDHGYVGTLERFEWIAGSQQACLRFHQLGFKLVVVTNQSGVARGYYTRAQMEAVHRQLTADLAALGVPITAIMVCPHHPQFSGPCDCRKPQAGMLEQACQRWSLNPSRSVMVGDSLSDIQAAQAFNVGCKILVQSGKAVCEQGQALADKVVPDLTAAAAFVATTTFAGSAKY